jgi:hypothetical protein
MVSAERKTRPKEKSIVEVEDRMPLEGTRWKPTRHSESHATVLYFCVCEQESRKNVEKKIEKKIANHVHLSRCFFRCTNNTEPDVLQNVTKTQNFVT